ncbi:MAG: bifunctional adenosylcobinamide kinase/adenosylcobinamide-phosphate guanylyltransferase [Pseudomonadota bacterium]
MLEPEKIIQPSSTLILGGARSGKSHYAQHLAESSADAPIYVATAQAGDEEMAARVRMHQSQRGPQWATIECSLALTELLHTCTSGQTMLVDCLTLWLSNHMLQNSDIERETNRLCAAVVDCPARLILVSNEVGMGLVPDNPLGRQFRDAQGRLNQALADCAEQVLFIAAGLPLVLKGELPS